MRANLSQESPRPRSPSRPRARFCRVFENENENEDENDRMSIAQSRTGTLAALAKPSLMHPCHLQQHETLELAAASARGMMNGAKRMTILFDYSEPAVLTHGGLLTQIKQTKAALEALGCRVDYLRWWDETQEADILHYFSRELPRHVRFAQAKGIKVVLGELLTEPGSRPGWHLWLQRQTTRLLRTAFPTMMEPFGWESHRLADAHVALTDWEAHLQNYLFDAPKETIRVIPNGVEDVFSEECAGDARPVAGLHGDDHRAQARVGAGRGGGRGANAAVGHRQGLLRLGRLWPEVCGAGPGASADAAL